MHTARYHHELLRTMPQPCKRALDVGCGTGVFARLLATRAGAVDAIDQSSEVVERARSASRGIDNLQFIAGDFMTHDFAPASYDFVCSLASLHHMPFVASVERMIALLRPGGVLGVIGLYRSEGLVDAIWSAMAWPVSRSLRLVHGRSNDGVPLRDPAMTLREIRAGFPGVVTRRLLWRYLGTVFEDRPQISRA
jgi:SAM-dependent methyltransferase